MYLDFEKYKQFGGKLEQSDFELALPIAELAIDTYTFYRLCDMETIPEKIVGCVAKATFYQIQYIDSSGRLESIYNSMDSDNIKSESIGNYSVTYENSEASKYFRSAGIDISPLACAELDKYGLRCNWIGGCFRK